MGANQRIKAQTKACLSGNWSSALAVTGVVLAFQFLSMIVQESLLLILNRLALVDIFSNESLTVAEVLSNPFYWLSSAVGWLFSFFLTAPVFLGALRYFYLLSQAVRLGGRELPCVGEVFYYFSSGRRFIRWLTFQVQLTLRGIVWAVISFLPGGLLVCFSGILKGSVLSSNADAALAVQSVFLLLAGELLLACGLVLFVSFMLRYFLSPFLLFREEDYTPAACMKESIRGMSHFRGKVFSLIMSFFGWLVLCILAFPVLYVLPYMGVALTVAAGWILEAGRDSGRQQVRPVQQTTAYPSYAPPSAVEQEGEDGNIPPGEKNSTLP